MKLKPYPKYKDSGIQWIGKIPEGWEVNKIRNTSYVKGRIGWHGLSSEEYSDKGAYLVTGTDFRNGVIDWEHCHHVGWNRYREDPYIHLRKNDLLITKDGTIGKVALTEILPDKATLNSGIFLVRPLNREYSTRFMYWMLNSAVFERFFDYIKTGATISHLYQETFDRFFFPIPPKPEQTAIASFLDKKTAKIDVLIEKDKKLIELLKEKRTALINHAVTRGLNPDAKLKDSGIEWIGKIPEGWEIKKIKFVSNKVVTGKTPPTDDDAYYENGNINWFTPSDLGNDLILKKSSKKITHLAILRNKVNKYNPNTVLLVGIGATLGKVGIITDTGTSNQQINAIEFDEKELYPKYGLYYLYGNKYALIGLSNASTIGIFNQTQTANFTIIIPTLPEQTTIANFLDKATYKIDKTIKKIEDKIRLLEKYKKSLIHYVVTGKVDIRGIEV